MRLAEIYLSFITFMYGIIMSTGSVEGQSFIANAAFVYCIYIVSTLYTQLETMWRNMGLLIAYY